MSYVKLINFLVILATIFLIHWCYRLSPLDLPHPNYSYFKDKLSHIKSDYFIASPVFIFVRLLTYFIEIVVWGNFLRFKSQCGLVINFVAI